MLRRYKKMFFLLILAFIVCAGALWQRQTIDQWLSKLRNTPLGQKPPEVSVSRGKEEQGASIPEESKTPQTQIPSEGGETQTASIPKQTDSLPPSPPLPRISPESSHAARREALQLGDSIDHIVTKDEPFEAGGKEYTIADILGMTHDDIPVIIPSIQEKEIGAKVRRSISAGAAPSSSQSSSYYGVRVVRNSENVWGIHYGILREYFARRQVFLSPDADRPHQDGRSSGVGRLLKFIEGVVHVYNMTENRLEKDLNTIHPRNVIVFFKISDFFSALDNIKQDDLSSIRYVSNNLRLERRDETRDLLDRRVLLE